MIWLLLLLLRIAWIVGASTSVRIVAIATIVVVVAIIGTTLATTHRIALIGATLVGLLLLLGVRTTTSVRGLLRLGTTLTSGSGTRTSGLLRLLRLLLLLVGLLLLGLLLLLLLAEEDTLLGCDGYASLEVTAQV